MVENSLDIGIVGGGQLAMMTALEARMMPDYDFRINILDPSPQCPAAELSSKQIIGDFKDPIAIGKLAEISDIITYEIELGDVRSLIELRNKGTKMHPSPEILELIQDKLIQKKFLEKQGIPVPRFHEVTTLDDIHRAVSDLGLPCLLKSRRDAYDGRGNIVIRRKDQIDMARKKFIARPVMVEEFVNFEQEISIISARGINGTITYPPGENYHEDGILLMTKIPGSISKRIQLEAERITRKTLEAFNDLGVFGIEMFVVNGKVLVNEVAPRVHNTGHGTLEKSAFETSQFEQHLRAISGVPVRGTEIKGSVVMQNILGSKDSFTGQYAIRGAEDVRLLPGVNLYLYGKREVRPLRKLGHLSVTESRDLSKNLDENGMDDLVRKARNAHSMLEIVSV